MAGAKTDDLLARVQRAAKLGAIITTFHVRKRMTERNVTAEDVEHAIFTSTVAIDQPEEQTIRLKGGTDVDGVELSVVVAEDPRGLRLVTAM